MYKIMTTILERKKTLESLLQEKTNILQQLETQRNNIVTEIVQIQGKIELLDELEHESIKKETKEEKEEDTK